MQSAVESSGAGRGWLVPAGTVIALVVLSLASVLVGVGHVDVAALLSGRADPDTLRLLLVSRVPRTAAIILSGMAITIAAVIMQMLFRNRFVEPTTAGTVEAASLGLVLVAILAPGLPILARMAAAASVALVATVLFLRLVERIPARSGLIVPLAGLMLGGVIQAVTVFLALRFDLLQSLATWTNGDFSGVLRGRYELLWIGFAVAAGAYWVADRFTVAGMGESFAANLGLDHRRIVATGLVIVSLVTSASVVTVGTIPFLGLIVANVGSLVMGDNLRRTLPWIAVSGAAFLLACDLAGRLIRHPYEIPVGTVAGVLGSALFLMLLLRPGTRLG
ncbi:ABC transporter permease [Aquibium microcysteis]|uniref:ABC transporter permease n=1 Tax=Aquibium microcysteis TaxID=675281 RepID=UPI00165CF0DC|nr:iron chelate uptake ABC transporter family permease subunit [Aquibium microcysteis]